MLKSVSLLSQNFIKSAVCRLYSINVNMEKHEIVSDVIPIGPSEIATVNYNSGVSCAEGNELTPRQVKDIPKVEWNADASSLYTLCLTDPDAPSRKEPTYREV